MSQGGCGRGVIHPTLRAWTRDSGLVISQRVPASLVPASLVSRGKSGTEERFRGQLGQICLISGLSQSMSPDT